MKKIIFVLGVVTLLIIGIGCVPPEQEPEQVIDPALREADCNKYLSFAYTNYQNRDFEGSVRNFKKMLNLGCGESHAQDVYEYMGRAYIELAKLDSASYIFNKGIQYLPEDVDLLEVAAWTEGRRGNVTDQIYLLDKILSFDESNMRIIEELNDVYAKEKMYDDQLIIVDLWLKYDPGNAKALGVKVALYNILGKDPLDVDRERWEVDKKDIQFGLRYANGLIGATRISEAVAVLEELRSYANTDTRILKLLAENYLKIDQTDAARRTYEDLYKLDKVDVDVPIALTDIFISEKNYSSAIIWAEKAVLNTAGNGRSYNNRAEVYFNCASECQGADVKFSDKLVYEMAYLDYKEAVARGYTQSKIRRDFLKENYITTTADWFMRPSDEYEAKPEGSCYGWIKKTIKRK